MAEVVLSGLSKSFGKTEAVKSVSMTIPDGAFVVLLGPTGAGKTTTLRLIAGLEKPDAGDVRIGGASVLADMPAQRDVAMVFQQYSLYPHLTVRDNLAVPLRSPILNWPEDSIATRVQQVAAVLKIAHKLDNKATRLSGGEMQRVSIGRAIVRTPKVFLMDEPLSALDAKLRESLRAELKDLQMTLGETFLLVTHDQVEAMSMGDRIGVLNKGTLVQVGTPQEIYTNPVNTFVARAVGSPAMNLLPGRLEGGRVMLGAGLALDHSGEAGAEGRALIFGIRPEDVELAPGAPLPATVTDVENHGVEKIVTLTAGPHRLRATVPVTVRVAAQDQVRIGWDPARVRLFDEATGTSLRPA
jgi:multiple sugar transport system ATP-binding protein